VRPIDVRVIAASNRSLEAAVAESVFREDLYFRLRVIEIVLPPLRERLEDVPILVDHFLARLADPPPRIERAAMERLTAYDWPGNVRELENELRRAYALAHGAVIRVADLSPIVAEGQPRPLAPSAEVPRLHDAVANLERELIERALRATGHHRGRTARLLGLSHQGLINKIRKYRLRVSPRRKNDQAS
jgi:DNA-binding NtrC family response regulator